MYQNRHITFCGTSPDKIRSVSFYGTARRCHWSTGTSPSFSCVRCHLSPDKADNHDVPLCRNILYPCLSVSSASAGPETHKTAVHEHSTHRHAIGYSVASRCGKFFSACSTSISDSTAVQVKCPPSPPRSRPRISPILSSGVKSAAANSAGCCR